MSRYDIVIYGATGFTGKFIVQRFVESQHSEGLTFAVAGRNKSKLEETLAEVGKKTGKQLADVPIILADSSNAESLANMAKQARVIINSVGPFIYYGEAVIKAAIDNGAHHVDITGEFPWVERMRLKYQAAAMEAGVLLVSSAAFDSVPCDLGVNYLKRNFGGDLNHVEALMQINQGPHGYSLNDGTYQTIVLSSRDFVGKMLCSDSPIMPERIVKGNVKAPFRAPISKVQEKEVGGYVIPNASTDQTVVNWSQYYGATVNQERPVHIAAYFRLPKVKWAILFSLWASLVTLFALIPPTRWLLLKYPDQLSFKMFKKKGPTALQIETSSFDYWFLGYGYRESLPYDQQHSGRPDRKVMVRCHGPDAGYLATSGCILSAALTILRDPDNVPKQGGFYTPAAAFGKSRIYEFLSSFGISFEIVSATDL